MAPKKGMAMQNWTDDERAWLRQGRGVELLSEFHEALELFFNPTIRREQASDSDSGKIEWVDGVAAWAQLRRWGGGQIQTYYVIEYPTTIEGMLRVIAFDTLTDDGEPQDFRTRGDDRCIDAYGAAQRRFATIVKYAYPG